MRPTFLIAISFVQLENPDEQAAAIRREVATREELLRDFARVNPKTNRIICAA